MVNNPDGLSDMQSPTIAQAPEFIPKETKGVVTPAIEMASMSVQKDKRMTEETNSTIQQKKTSSPQGQKSTSDDYPTFQGGVSSKFENWVASQVKYPEEALAKAIEGRVHVNYKVEIEDYKFEIEDYDIKIKYYYWYKTRNY